MKQLIKRIRRAFVIHNVTIRFYKCNYNIKLYDIKMKNNTNFLIKQCPCGKVNINRVHRESIAYKDWNK